MLPAKNAEITKARCMNDRAFGKSCHNHATQLLDWKQRPAVIFAQATCKWPWEFLVLLLNIGASCVAAKPPLPFPVEQLFSIFWKFSKWCGSDVRTFDWFRAKCSCLYYAQLLQCSYANQTLAQAAFFPTHPPHFEVETVSDHYQQKI